MVRMERDVTVAAAGDPPARKKKRWADFTPQQQRAIMLGATAELIITTIALTDLARRPTRAVRGPKPAWFLTFFVQPFGPILYFLVGRRSSAG
jgi:Phospholipase_D-nuclease N-terminal